MNSQEWYNSGNYASANDLSIFFKREGSGEPLVCIHGFPSSSWDFEKIWPSLTARFDVITPDLIGLGKSAKPNRPLPVSLQADMIEGLLLQQHIREAHILAHDLGDTIAQELLARQLEKSSPIKWKSCIFLNGGIFPETHRPLLIQKLLISTLGPVVVKLMSINSFRKNMVRIFSEAHPPEESFIKETWQLITEQNGISMIPRLIKYMEERKKYRTRWVTPLEKRDIPIRLINGIEDPISGLHAANRFKTVVPNADVILLEKSGHYPHVETPDEVIKAVFDFHDALGE